MNKYFYSFLAVLLTVLFCAFSWQNVYAQGDVCATATPFCTGVPTQYPAGFNPSGSVIAPRGPDYGCIGAERNPAWFYLQFDQIGTIELSIGRSPARDIDFAIWGPFAPGTTPSAACTTLNQGNIAPADCSYAGGTGIETPEVTATIPGQIFILMVTNFSNAQTDLTITQTGSSTGTTDCAIINDDCDVNLGADINLCQTDPRPTLDARRPSHNADTRYQWFVDGVSQGAASTTSTLAVQPHVPSLTPHIYKVIVTSIGTGSTGCNENEDEINVVIKPTPAINRTVFPNDSTLCSSAGAAVRIVASQPNISYQLLRNGTPFGGLVAGNGNVIQLPLTGIPAGVSTIQVQARYTTAPTCTVVLTEQAELTILGNIQVNLGLDKAVCENVSVPLDGSDASQPANATFQWQRSTDGGTTYTDIPLATNPTYTASETLVTPNTPFEVFYRLKVIIPASVCTYSDEIKITFEPFPLTDRTIEVDSLCVTGQGNIRIVNPQAGARYSYQLRENNAGVVGAAIGTAQFSATGNPIILTTPTITTTTKYFVEVKNTLAEAPCLVLLSTEPEVIIHPLPTAEFSEGEDLCQGETTELTVTMTGTQPFTITYQKDADPDVIITGINSNTYSFFTDEPGIYTIIRIQDAFCENLNNPIDGLVNVNPIPTFTLGNDTTLCDSQAPLVLRAKTPVDFENPTYVWLRDGVELIGETGETLTTTESSVGLAATTYEYTLEVTNNEALDVTNCFSSDDILVTFTPNPSSVITFAGSTFTNTGGLLQFCDTLGTQTLNGLMPDHASFANLAYQWKDLGTNTVVGTNSTLPVSNFGATTTYELLVTDGGTNPLCSNTASVTVQFITNPVATISHNGTVVPAGGSLDFCFDEGVQVLNGVDASHATIANVKYQWNNLTTGTSLGTTPQINVSNPTNTFSSVDYQLIVSDESNTVFCDRMATMTINFYPNPEAVISFNGTPTTSVEFCDSDGAKVLSGVTPDHAGFPSITYEWKNVATNAVVGNDPTLTVNNFSATTNYILTVGNGITPLCGRTATATVQYNANPVAEISHNGTAVPNGGNLNFCFDEGAQTLNGVHPSHTGLTVTYQWTDITNGTVLGTTPQIPVSNPTNSFASIDYQLIVKDESNTVFCERTATMTVNFYPNPEAVISFNGTPTTSVEFCDSDGAKVLSGVTPDHAGFPSITYEWKNVATNAVVGTSPTFTVDNFSATTTYVLTTSNGITPLCGRTATVTVKYNANPVAEISHNGTAVPNGGSLNFCFDEGAQTLNGVHPSHTGLTVTYQWTDITNGTSLGNNPQIDISNPTNTFASIDYELIVRDESNAVFCERTATMTVNFYPNPEAEISVNGNVQTGNTIEFCDSEGVQTLDGTIPNLVDVPTVTYQWTDLTTNTVVGTVATLDVDNFGQTTTYELLVSDNLPTSCERTAQITIKFVENPIAEISHDGTAIPDGGNIDFCFDEGAQTLNGVHLSHAGRTIQYEWFDVTAGVSLGNTPQISVSSPSNTPNSIEYALQVTDLDNVAICESATTITVNFLENPVAEIQFNGTPAPATLAFCDSEGARTLEGALPSHAAFGSVSYEWTQVGVGVVSNISTLVTPASNFSASATYELKVISNDNPNLCSRTDQVVIEFFPSPDTNISFEGATVTELGFCTSEGAKTVSAPASPFYTYQWYRGTLANPLQTALGTIRTQSVDNFATQGGDTNSAIYTVVVTDTRATCPAQSFVKVDYYAEPEIDAATLVVTALPATHCVTGTSTISVRNAEQGVEYQLTRAGVPVASSTQTPNVDLSTITFPVTESTTLTTGVSRFEYGIIATRIGAFGRRCTQTLADTATLLVYPAPTATVAGTATVCANEPTNVTFTITGNFPATLVYQVTDTFNVARTETQIVGAVGSSSPQTFVINTNRNSYRPLSITDRYCSGTVTATEAVVTTVHPPIVTWVEYDTAFCINEAATFKVRGGISQRYYINGLPVSTQNPYIIQPNTLAVGTYKIYAKGFATANGCSANSDTITFRVHPLPVVDLGVDRIKCKDDTTYLVVRNTGSFIYDWKRIKTDNTVVSVGNGNDSLGVSLAGRYFVLVTNLATGCSDSSNIIKIENYTPVLRVNLGPDVTVCSPSTVPHRLVASDIAHPQGTLYKWYKENSNAVIGTDSVYSATAEGIYRVTVTDPRGCKAKDTIRVNFTADPDFRITGHDNYACGVQDTLKIEATNLRRMLINWQGAGIVSLSDSNRRAIVNVSGIYTVTVTDTSTVARCSTTKSVEVFVRPKIALVLPNTGTGDTTTICQGDSLVLNAFDPIHNDNYQYRWKWLEANQVIATTSKVKITYNTTQSFTSQRFEVKVTDPNGECFSTDTVNVRFRRKPIARITASDSVICIGESIVLQGGESFGNRFEWIRLPETASFATTTNVTVTPDSVGETVYILKAYFDSSTPCGAINDTIRIRVNRKAVANIEQDEIRLCENEQLEIDGFLPENPALTRYVWTHEENNLVLSTDSVLNVSFSDIQPISYEPFHIVLTVYDLLTGCDSTDRVLVKFNRASKITIDSTYRRAVCLGDSVKLRARGATSYSWRRLGDTTNTVLDSTSQITVKLDTVGFHTFIVTGGYLNECQNTGDTAIIFVNPLPTIRAHSVDTVSICAEDSITLTPSGGKSYVWLNDPTAFETIRVSPKVPTNYIVLGTDSNGCQAIDTVHVYVTPTFELPELLQVCEKEMVMIGDSLNFTDSLANTRVSYFWRETGDTTSFITVGESGTYTVEVSIDDCNFTRTTEVQVKEKPKLELVSDTTLCFELGEEDRFQRGETHILRSKLLNKDSTTTYLYVWTDSTGQFLGNRDSLEIDAGGNYRLRVIARYDTECETSDSTFVVELCQPRFYVPEAFTPNDDNLNDNFEVFGKHIKNFEMQIFNRWSEVIYEVKAKDMEDLQPQDFWDGKHKNKNVPTGVYIWIIRYTDPFSGSTKQVQKTGSLMIVR